jgi:hypothetical protein
MSMNRAGWVAAGISAAAIVALVALAAPALGAIGQAAERAGSVLGTASPAAQPAASHATSTPSPTPRDGKQAKAWEIGCDDFANVGGYVRGPRPSPRPDRGSREFASGTVTFGADGGVETYTVAPGDAGEAIGERFCVDYITLYVANDKHPTVHPGDVLQINP